MAIITVNQHSYSNAYALLNVSATATRTSSDKISITADWSIYTSGSNLNASRYLVLFIDSKSGTKYYSTALRSSWTEKNTYTGSYTFNNIPLDAASTSIKIGFGVSKSNSSLSTSGILVFNGDAEVSHASYDPDIQFKSITGIAQGYTACTAPTSVTLTPDEFVDSVTITWSGATGGTNNSITGYDVQFRWTTDGVWGNWVNSSVITTSGQVATQKDRGWGESIQYRVRTKGTAGSSYYSAWKESNVASKINPIMYIHNGTDFIAHEVYVHNGTDFVRHLPHIFDGENWVLYPGY